MAMKVETSLSSDSLTLASGAFAGAPGAVALGRNTRADSAISVAIGDGAHSVSSVAVGVQSLAGSLNSTAIGDYAKVGVGADNGVAIGARAEVKEGVKNAVALGADTIATRDNSVSVGGRQITDVADPTSASDVTTKNYVDTKMREEFQAFDASLTRRLDGMKAEYRGGIAGGIASSNAVSAALRAGGSALGVGLGTFGGQQAVAVGLAAKVGYWAITGNLQASANDIGAGVGVALPLKF